MDIPQIEDEVLHLSSNERAVLLQKLVLSFGTPPAKELRADWLAEAALSRLLKSVGEAADARQKGAK